MIGAIIGDIVGSRFEFNNTSRLDFELFTPECSFTDDTICTVAIAEALLDGTRDYQGSLLRWCRKYPHPMGGYGGSFARWINSPDPQPYNSFGNGAAMRVSPVAWLMDDADSVFEEAIKTALPTHNHPEGIKGAAASALAVYMGRKYSKEAVVATISETYPLIMPDWGCNRFDETCQGTMPVVLGILNKANSFEEAIRYSVAVGGDSDTIAAIVGSIAEAIWGIPEEILNKALTYLPVEMEAVFALFNHKVNRK